MKKNRVAIGIDIGGTNTKLGVVDEDGNVIFKLKNSIKTPSKSLNLNNDIEISDSLLESFISQIVKEINNAIDSTRAILNDFEIVGIGIGAPNGCFFTGSILQAPNLPFVGDVNIVELLKSKLENINNIVLTNDANAAAIGEMKFGGGKNIKNFVFITMGTGIGSGIIVNGEILHGKDGFAGEIGHTVLIPDGRKCGCGINGHLEAYCSASGVVKSYLELKSKNKNIDASFDIDNLPETEITTYDVYLSAKKGNKIAKETFEYTGKLLGIGLANVVHLFSPETIFLFGGVTSAAEYFLDIAQNTMEENLLPSFKNKVIIQKSQLHDDNAAIVGASALVF